jgi:hypothetical protein
MREQQGLTTHASAGQGSLSAGVASANNDNVKKFRIVHDKLKKQLVQSERIKTLNQRHKGS